MYGFWLLLWYLVHIVLSVILRCIASDYSFDILCTLYCLSFFDVWLLITPLISCAHCIVCHSSMYGFWLLLWYLVNIVLSVILRCIASDYSFDILWTLYCLSFFDVWLLITPSISCAHCIVCHSSMYGFWLLFWYNLKLFLASHFFLKWKVIIWNL